MNRCGSDGDAAGSLLEHSGAGHIRLQYARDLLEIDWADRRNFKDVPSITFDGAEGGAICVVWAEAAMEPARADRTAAETSLRPTMLNTCVARFLMISFLSVRSGLARVEALPPTP